MFGKRMHLLSVKGISIGVDISWIFIAILLTWTLAAGFFPHYYPNLDASSYFFMGLVGMLGLFVSVILHELGHAFTAQYFELPISRITLFVFGGVAELRQDPPSPKSEFLVAVAGPIVSVVLSVVFGLCARLGEIQGWSVPVVAVLGYLSLINIIVVIFNLIPAFPLDGGRIFRAFLWWKKGSLGWATRVTSRLGSAFGMGLIFFGIFVVITGNFIAGMWWMILGLFLQHAASMSQTQYYIKKELRSEKVEKYMVRNPLTVPPDISIQDFIDLHVYQTYHHLYPVIEGDELFGYISLEEVKAIDRENWGKTQVRDILVPLGKIDTLSPQMEVLDAFALFNKTTADSLLVIEGNKLVGLLSASDLSRVISLKLELEGAK